MSPRPLAAIIADRAEYVSHRYGCPSIGGNGDTDCTCGAVEFLKWTDRVAALEASATPPNDEAEEELIEARDMVAQSGMCQLPSCEELHLDPEVLRLVRAVDRYVAAQSRQSHSTAEASATPRPEGEK